MKSSQEPYLSLHLLHKHTLGKTLIVSANGVNKMERIEFEPVIVPYALFAASFLANFKSYSFTSFIT